MRGHSVDKVHATLLPVNANYTCLEPYIYRRWSDVVNRCTKLHAQGFTIHCIVGPDGRELPWYEIAQQSTSARTTTAQAVRQRNLGEPDITIRLVPWPWHLHRSA